MTLTEIKQAAAAHLMRRKWILRKQVLIISDDAGDIKSAVDTTLAKLGLCAIVGNLAARATSSASRSIVCQSSLVVTIYESPLINRAKADHADVATLAEYIAGCLNLTPLTPRGKKTGDAVLPVFLQYAIAWQSPASAKATVIFNVPSTINPPED